MTEPSPHPPAPVVVVPRGDASETRLPWSSLGLDARTLEQPPHLSLRMNALPPVARIPAEAEQPLLFLRTLGEGGMGMVRLAEQRALRREVAVRTVKPSAGERARNALRDVMFSNRVNRQMFLGTTATLASVAALRLLVVLSEIPLTVGFRLELVLYAMAFAMFGIVSNHRAHFGGMIFLIGATVDALLDRGDLYVIAATVFCAFAALSWAWHTSARAAEAKRPD